MLWPLEFWNQVCSKSMDIDCYFNKACMAHRVIQVDHTPCVITLCAVLQGIPACAALQLGKHAPATRHYRVLQVQVVRVLCFYFVLNL